MTYLLGEVNKIVDDFIHPKHPRSVKELVEDINYLSKAKTLARIYWHKDEGNTKIMVKYLLKYKHYEMIDCVDEVGREYTDFYSRRI